MYPVFELIQFNKSSSLHNILVWFIQDNADAFNATSIILSIFATMSASFICASFVVFIVSEKKSKVMIFYSIAKLLSLDFRLSLNIFQLHFSNYHVCSFHFMPLFLNIHISYFRQNISNFLVGSMAQFTGWQRFVGTSSTTWSQQFW